MKSSYVTWIYKTPRLLTHSMGHANFENPTSRHNWLKSWYEKDKGTYRKSGGFCNFSLPILSDPFQSPFSLKNYLLLMLDEN